MCIHKMSHFSSCDRELCPLTFIVELDLDRVQMNQHARYLGHRSLIFRKLLSGHIDTQQTSGCTRTTKVVGSECSTRLYCCCCSGPEQVRWGRVGREHRVVVRWSSLQWGETDWGRPAWGRLLTRGSRHALRWSHVQQRACQWWDFWICGAVWACVWFVSNPFLMVLFSDDSYHVWRLIMNKNNHVTFIDANIIVWCPLRAPDCKNMPDPFPDHWPNVT